MIKKYIRNTLVGGAGYTAEPEHYGVLAGLAKDYGPGDLFLLRIRGDVDCWVTVYDCLEERVSKNRHIIQIGGVRNDIHTDDLHEFGSGLDGAEPGEEFLLELVEMEESEFEELCEKNEFGGY